MGKTTVEILHYPRLDTVIMVEDALQNAKEYPAKMQLWKSLPKKVQYQTYQLILKYLEKSNKILFTEDSKIMWIGSNPKLDAIVHNSKEL